MPKRLISFDFESFLINTMYPEPYGWQGLAPKLVCMSWQELRQPAEITVTHEEMMVLTHDWISDDNVILIAQNAPFEMYECHMNLGVPMEKIFDKFNKGLIKDTYVRETMLHLATGDAVRHPNWYADLGSMVSRHLGIDISASKGEDAWRMRYSELIDVPLDEWPQEAIDYSLLDSEYTLKVFAAQHKQRKMFEANELKQTRSFFDLHLISAKSPSVNQKNADEFIAAQQTIYEAATAPLIAKGILKPNANRHKEYEKGDPRRAGHTMDTKLMKRLVQADYTRQGKVVPGTPSGDISIAGDVLLGCKTKILKAYGEAAFEKKMLESFAPALRKALQHPERRVTPRYGVLKKTGRTGCQYPNMQNVSKAPGARECFEAPEGKVFVSIDYSSMEVYCLAQTMYTLYGNSILLDVLNAGMDPHLIIAAETMDQEYGQVKEAHDDGDELVDKYRDFGKVQNFGYGGGMGAPTTLSTMPDSMIELLHELYPGQFLETVVKDSIAAWKSKWGLTSHFNKMGRLCQGGKKPTYTCPTTGRIKALNTYCQLCNMHFQPIAADALKEAIAIIQESCWIPGRFLNHHGVELAIEIHDENVMAGPEATLDQWVPCVQQMMIEGAQKVLPDCKIKTDAEVCGKFWKKKGLPVADYMDKFVIN